MHRIWAILLVAVFAVTLIGPSVFASDGEQNLPPCCRHNGKHHCAMLQDHGPSSGPAFRMARCPLFGSVSTLPAPVTRGMPKLAPAIISIFFSHPAARPQTEALARISFDRSSQKRGPPFLS
jgi:hypothetical protein